MIKGQIKKKIVKAVKDLKIDSGDFVLDRSVEASFGDYATNVALKAGDSKLAQKLAEELTKDSLVEKTEVKNGFINIFLKPEVWQKELADILKRRENYSVLTLGGEKTVNVEFISANPTGELHVGNGRGAFFGDVLANVLEKAGYNVEREYLVNDAKTSLQIGELGKTALGKGEAYLTDYLKNIIKELKPKLKGVTAEADPSRQGEAEAEAGYIVASRITEDIKKFVTEELKIKFDKWFSEEELFKAGRLNPILKRLPTYEKDGAVWAKTSEYGDDEDRVLVRSNGQPGYFLSDITYHLEKASRANIMIDIWGADHQGHVKRMFAMGKLLNFADKLKIFITQMVSLKEMGEGKKMSKRSGDLVSLKWLIDEVGLDAARFFYLSKSLNTHMDFDVALAKEQSKKNPVYYIQYSYARSHQIFAKAGTALEDIVSSADLSLLKEPSEFDLIKKLSEWPEIIELIVEGEKKSGNYDIHKICTYATELSAVFHKFYEKNKVLVDENDLKMARLALIRGYQIILKDVLNVLGISAPEKM